jgi:transcriptional regulator with XRE-family HTH domain
MPTKYTLLDQHEEFQALLKIIKRVLKERNITYLDLAKNLHMSESGVKKIFRGEDCSFKRLMEISKVLGLRLTDLLYEVEHQEMKSVQFSKKQQDVFLKDKALFYFFIKLVIERMTVDEIKKESKLTDSQTFKYLKALDNLELIRLLPQNKIKIPQISFVNDFGQGPLLEKTYQEWGHQLVDDLAKPELQSSSQFIIRNLKMKSETYQEFLRQLRDLEKHFAKRALREMAVSITNLKSVRWMSFTDQQSFVPGPLEQLKADKK